MQSGLVSPCTSLVFHTLDLVIHLRGRIQAHPLDGPGGGFQVSYENGKTRTTFDVVKPPSMGEEEPLAIESFAIQPERYAELMARVEALVSRA